MAFYDNSAATALGLITKFGKSLPFSRISKTYDPVAGAVSASVATSQIVKGVNLPIKANDAAGMSEYLIQALTAGRLRKYIIATKGTTFELRPLDVGNFDGEFWTVRGLTALDPAGTQIIWTLFVEKGNLSAADIAALPA